MKHSGEICWKGEIYYLSQVLALEDVALIPFAEGIWNIYYHFLGQMNEREKRIVPATSWHQQEGGM
ncbi:hypothetical protein [Gallibacterium salpingitidis]|uniref:hypothetical protein n=1 Tax=Gallibacterium salpingitidis TaxID=505341 RepID=UPI0009ED27D2|nr:hypothetical protein [Gallibacterium salpingitidis]WKS99393.1 hypothetical protein NYR30_11855 [Gallibacterium salpingitidis]